MARGFIESEKGTERRVIGRISEPDEEEQAKGDSGFAPKRYYGL